MERTELRSAWILRLRSGQAREDDQPFAANGSTSGALASTACAKALGQPTRLPGGTGRRESGQRASSITDSI
jgi:hypothetical protein